MTALSTLLSFQVRVTGVDGNSFLARTRQNVKKPVANILYLEEPPADAIKLAYVGSKELSPTRDVFIGDRSDSLFQNARTGTISEFVAPAKNITVRNQNIIVTQIFNEADSGDIPLYYKHSLGTDIIPESVRVYNQNFNEVSKDTYKLVLEYVYDETTGLPTSTIDDYVLYSNLESSYDQDTGEYIVYFIQYTENISGTDVTKTELLNNDLAYHKATFEDIWTVTMELKPWSHSYSVDNNTASGTIITMSADELTSVRYEEYKRVSVKSPIATNDTSPWFPRIINGSFRSGYGIYSLFYEIPEFQNQAFNPIEPYKLAIRTNCLKIDDHLIKLPHESLEFGAMFSPIKIIIADEDGVEKYAVTNDAAIDGDDYLNIEGERVYNDEDEAITWSTSSLLGIDRLSGIVHVDIDIKDSYEIYATYPYKEQAYTLTSLNMNPVFDSSAASEVRIIYLVPQSDPNNNLGTQTESIKWLKVSPSGLINATNQNGDGYNENIDTDVALEDTDGYGITGVLGLHYNWKASTTANGAQEIQPNAVIQVAGASTFPNKGWIRFKDTLTNSYTSGPTWRYAKYIEKTSTSLTLSGEEDQIPSHSTDVIEIASGGAIQLVNFEDERTTNTTRDYDEEMDDIVSNIPQPLPISYSQYFVLAELAVNPPHGLHEAVKIDLREDGGGVKEEKYEEAKQENPEAQWYTKFGNFNGQPFPGKAVVVVNLPESIKDNFSTNQINTIVENNIAFGIKPLIRYYGYKPEITSLLPGTSSVSSASIIVKWKKLGPEFTYDVWYAKHKNGPWLRHNDHRLTDDIIDYANGVEEYGSAPYSTVEENTYTIDGLEVDEPYFVKISCNDKYYLWWYSYSSYNSIGGGYGSSNTMPTPDGGNILSFQVNV